MPIKRRRCSGKVLTQISAGAIYIYIYVCILTLRIPELQIALKTYFILEHITANICMRYVVYQTEAFAHRAVGVVKENIIQFVVFMCLFIFIHSVFQTGNCLQRIMVCANYIANKNAIMLCKE